jgi:hypothetical protein
MLNSEKNFSLCAAKKINILTRVVEKKHHNPPFKLNGQSLSTNICEIELNQSRTNKQELECVSWMNLNTVQPVLKGTSV